MKKICEVCNDDFVGHFNRKYCSSQCQEEALKRYHSEVLFPDIDKAHKFQLSDKNGKFFHYKW